MGSVQCRSNGELDCGLMCEVTAQLPVDLGHTPPPKHSAPTEPEVFPVSTDPPGVLQVVGTEL